VADAHGLGDTCGKGAGRNDRAVLEPQATGSRERVLARHQPYQSDHASRDGASWDHPDWIRCDDPNGPRWRPIEPGSSPLADGAPSRVGRLRAYGNALCAPQAEAFVRARMDLEVTA
jgi:DNA (cytosine-5)-methyltransferase 1